MIPGYVKFINVETFHSFGFRIVRKFNREDFEILDADWKKVKIIEEVLQHYFREKEPDGQEIADILGGRDGLVALIDSDKIEVEHLGFIRGRDIKHTIIMCSEAENMTKEHVQLLLGRVGEDSALWLNGDYKQTDHKTFAENNGLMTAVDRLKGHNRFGYVKLLKTERSETAAMADLLD